MPTEASHIPRGPVGVWRALRWSLNGFRAAWLNEASFRLEAVVAVLLIPLALAMDEGPLEKLLLVLSLLGVLTVELINSAIEAAIDRHGPEFHELSGRAKDLGSAAVLAAIVASTVTWATVLLT